MRFKDIVSERLHALAPDLFNLIRAYRFRRRCRAEYWDFQQQVRSALYGDGDVRVLGGPFAGMRYIDEVVWGPITPKWIGSYEDELHDVFEEAILPADYDAIVDVGAAEGYYAVGLARAFPSVPVHAFDIDPFARGMQRRLAARNGVENLHVRKRCTHRSLNELLHRGHGLLVCDVEGFEYTLLDPAKAPVLERTDILVELHHAPERPMKVLKETLIGRFTPTHEITLVRARPAEPAPYARLADPLGDLDTVRRAINEGRNFFQIWLWMKVR